jgi:hypothetical protein
MNRRDIVVGIIILAVLGGIIYFWRNNAPKEEITSPETLSTTEERLEKAFGLDIPDELEKTELTAVNGFEGSAIATRNYQDGKFQHTVLADLADPQDGSFYEGWLVRGEPGDDDFDVISTGRMRKAKGGWILEYSSSKDLTDHEKVVITLEEVADSTPEMHVLEGSF